MIYQKIAVFTESSELFGRIRRIIPNELAEVRHILKADGQFIPPAIHIAIVDGAWPKFEQLIEALTAQAAYTILVEEEKRIGDHVPESLARGFVDDLLLVPIRPVELLSKIKHAAHLSRVHEVASVNVNLKQLIEKFEEDLRTTRAVQKTLIPEKFNAVHGLKVTHKYLSGLKSGGDYLDFFEFEDNMHVGILMSDSSGYGLSSAFMSVVLKLALKLSKEEARSPSATVKKIFEELQLTMKPTENLSLFYGILNRKTFELKYTSGGTIQFIHQGDAHKPRDLSSKTAAFVKNVKPELRDQTIVLNPGDRMVLFSDGFAEAFEDKSRLNQIFDRSLKEEAIELINQFAFSIKSKFSSDDDMPNQDCSVMVIDVEKRMMRLAK
ncbi:MAG: SpoIIE family protein phosphatase [Bdellovibrionota bacterium]